MIDYLPLFSGLIQTAIGLVLVTQLFVLLKILSSLPMFRSRKRKGEDTGETGVLYFTDEELWEEEQKKNASYQ